MKRLCTGMLALVLLSQCGNGNKNSFEASVLVEGTAVDVPAQTGGVLLERRFDEGDTIELGDTLAIVDVEKLQFDSPNISNCLKTGIDH